jgi:hypothetical protein
MEPPARQNPGSAEPDIPYTFPMGAFHPCGTPWTAVVLLSICLGGYRCVLCWYLDSVGALEPLASFQYFTLGLENDTFLLLMLLLRCRLVVAVCYC